MLRCELKIVSDANSFFIERILKHHGVWNCFSDITANPSYVNEEGKLRVCPYHDYVKSSHGCNLCPPNMCKATPLTPSLSVSLFMAHSLILTFILSLLLLCKIISNFNWVLYFIFFTKCVI